MSNLEFAWPYAALLLLLIVPLWLFYAKEASGYLASPIALAMQRLTAKSHAATKRQIPWWSSLLWTLLVLALMRPQLVGEPLEIRREGRNLMLVVDLSESMEALDMTMGDQRVDRLVVAKDVLQQFIDARSGDRMGLVVFGSESFLHAPITFDHLTLKRFLDDAQIGFAGPKTAIGDAIGLATKKLVEGVDGDRVIVLLTDGQNNTGSLEPMQAAQIAKKHNVKIYAVGLGASRMIVDGFFGPVRVNPSESLDEAEPEMKELAALTGGKYFRARDHQALATIYHEIDALEPIKVDPHVIIPRKDLFFWPLAAVLLLVLLRIMWSMRGVFGVAQDRRPVREG